MSRTEAKTIERLGIDQRVKDIDQTFSEIHVKSSRTDDKRGA